MELVYLWVEKHKNIHEQGFNFSSRFNCKYDPDSNELTIKDNDDYIDNFFGGNIDVTAIVGKNGSGKSSVLEVLQRIFNVGFFTRIEDNSDLKFILLLKVEPELHDQNDFFDQEKEIIALTNIKETGLPLNKLGSRTHREMDELVSPLFFDSEMPYNKFNKYEIASKNFFHPTDFEEYKEYFYIDLDYNSICKKILELQLKEFSVIDFSPYQLTIRENNSLILNALNSFKQNLHVFPRFNDDFMDNIELISEMIKGPKAIFLFSIFLSFSDEIDEDIFLEIVEYIEANYEQNESEIIAAKLEEVLKNIIDTNIGYEEYQSCFANNKKISEIDYELVEKYIDYLDINILDRHGRSFNSLSHGEKIFFGTIVNIMSVLYQEKEKNYLLCFDEPDLSLHPNWQKKYIHELIKVCTDNNIHLIFTTHSPFLLSDIPKQNIIFLDTYKENSPEAKEGKQKVGNCRVLPHDEIFAKKQTFGANIHTLLSDSFFMEGGLMGEFAKGKINEIIEFHNKVEEENTKETSNSTVLKTEYEEKKKHFWDIQSIIGEEYLKQVIKNHLVEIEKILLGKDEAKNEEIARTKEYLKSLENDKS